MTALLRQMEKAASHGADGVQPLGIDLAWRDWNLANRLSRWRPLLIKLVALALGSMVSVVHGGGIFGGVKFR